MVYLGPICPAEDIGLLEDSKSEVIPQVERSLQKLTQALKKAKRIQWVVWAVSAIAATTGILAVLGHLPKDFTWGIVYIAVDQVFCISHLTAARSRKLQDAVDSQRLILGRLQTVTDPKEVAVLEKLSTLGELPILEKLATSNTSKV